TGGWGASRGARNGQNARTGSAVRIQFNGTFRRRRADAEAFPQLAGQHGPVRARSFGATQGQAAIFRVSAFARQRKTAGFRIFRNGPLLSAWRSRDGKGTSGGWFSHRRGNVRR